MMSWHPKAADGPALRLTPPCRLGLVSDTHGWLDPRLIEAFAGLDAILHAGDVGREEVLEALRAIAPTVAVRGNIDGGALHDLPLTAHVEVGQRRIALLHIAGNPGRPNREARRLIDQLAPEVLIVGHSHIPVAGRVGDLTWINPGAAGREGFHPERTAAYLEIDSDAPEDMRLLQIGLGPRGQAATS